MKVFARYKIGLPVLVLIACMVWAAAEFRVPDLAAREVAVGSLRRMGRPMQQAFTAGDDFLPKKEPRFSDWLTQHEEAGQTFPEYLASKPNRPGTGGRNTLYLLPLGDFAKDVSPDIKTLQRYMELYYAPMTVKVLPAIPAPKVPAVSRKNSLAGQLQWNSVQMLGWLRTQVPRNAYGLLAVTMTDLYPGEEWNFVFGQASYKNRVGIFSFARYHPKLSFEDVPEKEADLLTLRRAGKVLTHEMGHMFGIKHCTHYECNMNGANSLREADSTPMHVCPVCLRKLQHAIGFDPAGRYRDLEVFYRKNHFVEEQKWVKHRLDWIAE